MEQAHPEASMTFTVHAHSVRTINPTQSTALQPLLSTQHARFPATSVWRHVVRLLGRVSTFGNPSFFDLARRGPAQLRVSQGQIYDPDSFWMVTDQRV